MFLVLGLTVEVGDKHDAVVLDILLTENCVEVIFDKIVVHSVKKLKDTPQAQVWGERWDGRKERETKEERMRLLNVLIFYSLGFCWVRL